MNLDEVLAKIDSIPGWFDRANIDDFAGLNLPSEPTIVECGTYMGRSTTALSYLFPGSKIYTCDPETIPHHLPKGATFYYGKGQDMSVPTDIDLLFIDDSHSYDDIKANYEHFYPSVKVGGYIVFHDYHFPTAGGVKEFVDELGGCRISDSGEFGLAICQKEL